jgi:hypothetical protein
VTAEHDRIREQIAEDRRNLRAQLVAAARLRAYRVHAAAGLPRSCPGCGAPHSLAEVCR